jgi:uncharacterized protein (TIGR03083 family)
VEWSRYLECLSEDTQALRAAARRNLGAPVPTCPAWTAADLVRHVAVVYLHKAEAMRRKAFPDPWPPPGVNDEEPVALLDRSYAELRAEFSKRSPDEPTVTWYDPEQDVGFWIRRMAQEAVIHRVDAELAAGGEASAIPSDLALDGVDEVLVRFLSYDTTNYAQHIPELAECDGRSVRVRADGGAWMLELTPKGVRVTDGGEAAATVAGAPDRMLLGLWRRAGDETISIDGDTALVAQLRTLLGVATQ